MKYEVTLTRIYNGRLEVEASNEKDAMEIAHGLIDRVDWIYGESTVDYAEKLDEGKR